MTGTACAPGLQLHLGCGKTHLEGWINCDETRHSPHVDAAFDLMGPWPYAPNTVQAVYASHVLEHLPDPLYFFRELWRVLQPVSNVLVRVPHGGHHSAMADLTHLHHYWPETFAFLQPGYREANGNPQHETDGVYFGIAAMEVRLAAGVIPWLRWRLLRRPVIAALPYLPQTREELWASLFPLKTPEAQATYRATHPPTLVPLTYFVYAHDWTRRPLPEGAAVDRCYVATCRAHRRLPGFI
jgi:SAM-dependent methyltransferase